MKTSSITLLALVALSATVMNASPILLSDDFSGSSLDSSKWQVITPYSTSSVVQNNGTVTLTSRGILASQEEVFGSYVINGSFTMNNDFEGFNVHLRTDLSPLPDSDLSYALSGMFINFSNSADQVHIEGRGYSPQFSTTNSHGAYSLMTGSIYFFSIYDYGTGIEVWINGQKEFWANTDVSTGGHVAFSNREFPFTSTSLDGVTIARVPELSSTLALAMVSIIALGYFRRNVHFQ